MGRLLSYTLVFYLFSVIYACDVGGAHEFDKPLVHFSADMFWVGEPTGLLFYEGSYHLFYQHNPADSVYGNIHWGHAVSKDLYHWEKRPIALCPDSIGYLKSGSVVADERNLSGWGSLSQIPLIAYYTYQADKGVGIYHAYSLDGGENWTKLGKIQLEREPGVALNSPQVKWNAEVECWLMTVSTGYSILFYQSTDCKRWKYLSEFTVDDSSGSNMERTDFFRIRVSEQDSYKWVLLVNMSNGPANGAPDTRYFVGDFSGEEFIPTQNKKLWIDYGKDNYAGGTFEGLPDDDRIFLGWMNCWEYANSIPGMNGRGGMIAPRMLNLVEEGNHYVLQSKVHCNIEKLYGGESALIHRKQLESNTMSINSPYRGKPFVLHVNYGNKDNTALWKAGDYGVRFVAKNGRSISIGYQNELSYFYIDRSGCVEPALSDWMGQLMGGSYRSSMDAIDWYILYDYNSVELVAANGRINISSLCYLMDDIEVIEFFADSGSVTINDSSIVQLIK